MSDTRDTKRSEGRPTYEELVEALANLRTRFHRACIASGSEEEFADLACVNVDSLLTRCRQGGESNNG